MRTSTKRSENLTSTLKKFGNRAKKLYPGIAWVLHYGPDDITQVYGDGFMVQAQVGIHTVEYFILAEDPRMDNWIHMMASQLREEVNGK